MIFPKEPTLVQDEVLPKGRDGSVNPLYPSDNFCKSGHIAAKGSRFFKVTSPTLEKERWGIYCETCLRIAHKLAAKRSEDKKKHQGIDFSYTSYRDFEE